MNRREEYEKTQTAVTREEAQATWDRLGEIDRDHWVIWNGELTTDPRYREERESCTSAPRVGTRTTDCFPMR